MRKNANVFLSFMFCIFLVAVFLLIMRPSPEKYIRKIYIYIDINTDNFLGLELWDKNNDNLKLSLFLIDNGSYIIFLLCSQWLYDLCRGIEFEAVKPRQLPKSIGCSKNFPGKTSLATKQQVQTTSCRSILYTYFWIQFLFLLRLLLSEMFFSAGLYLFMLSKCMFMLNPNLCAGAVLASSTGPGAGGEVDQRQRSGKRNHYHFFCFVLYWNCDVYPFLCHSRLLISHPRFLTVIQNGRVAKLLTVGVRQLGDKRQSSFSRCCALVRYEATKISSDSFAIIKSLNTAGNQQAAW